MIVITKNGKTTVVTGWRAWLIGAVVAAAVSLVIALVVFVALGVAVTVGMLLFIIVPVAVGVGLLASLVRPRA
jgi:hypothetical protein